MGAGGAFRPAHPSARSGTNTLATVRERSAFEARSRRRNIIRRNIMLLLLWIADGVAAGYLTGKFMSSEGRDWVLDIVMGLAGGIGGGFLLSATHTLVHGKMIYTSLAAILGAVVLAGLSRSISGRREYGSTD
jgi:uncharacterized membrane protein YeaQ/YmgE (transglycosylase-associated protein family)